MEVQQENTEHQTDYTVSEIHDICEKYVRRYFEHQKIEILANLRVFARHDREINYFMDRIMDELKIHLNKYKKEAVAEIKTVINEQIDKYDNQRQNAISKVEEHLNMRLKDIMKKEPYDLISKNFLEKMENRLRIDYHDKVENMQIFSFIMIVINIGLIIGYYWKLL